MIINLLCLLLGVAAGVIIGAAINPPYFYSSFIARHKRFEKECLIKTNQRRYHAGK